MAVFEQVGEMCFTEVTLSVFSEPPDVPEAPAPEVLAPDVPLDDDAGEAVPLTSTVWPTCSASLDVSPVN